MKKTEEKKTVLGDTAPGVRLPVAAALALITLIGVDLFHGGNGLVALGAACAFLVGLWLANAEAKREVKAELEEKPKQAIYRLTAPQLGAAVYDPLYIMNEAREVAFANDAAQEAFGSVAMGASLQLKFRAPEVQELLDRLVSSNPTASMPRPSEKAQGFLFCSFATRARRAASRRCAPTSSPMQAMSFERRLLRSQASSKHCADRRGKTRKHAITFCPSCMSRPAAWRG